MTVDLGKYSDELNNMYVLYRQQRNRLNRYNETLYTFTDGEEIDWTSTQQVKALGLAKDDVTAMELVVAELKIALGIP